jgi:hypothetical protein
MSMTEAELVEIIGTLKKCRRQRISLVVVHASNEAFDQAVEGLLKLRASEPAHIV